MLLRRLRDALAIFVLSVLPALASGPEPVRLAPIDGLTATLVVVKRDGTERTYSVAEIEALPTYSLVTTTPWRAVPARFEGVLLRDLLAANGLDDAAAIRVVAENEFESTLERAVWETVPVLVATRVDGRPHTRRERGPLQFVVPMDVYTSEEVVSERHLVWMVARIEPSQ